MRSVQSQLEVGLSRSAQQARSARCDARSADLLRWSLVVLCVGCGGAPCRDEERTLTPISQWQLPSGFAVSVAAADSRLQRAAVGEYTEPPVLVDASGMQRIRGIGEPVVGAYWEDGSAVYLYTRKGVGLRAALTLLGRLDTTSTDGPQAIAARRHGDGWITLAHIQRREGRAISRLSYVADGRAATHHHIDIQGLQLLGTAMGRPALVSRRLPARVVGVDVRKDGRLTLSDIDSVVRWEGDARLEDEAGWMIVSLVGWRDGYALTLASLRSPQRILLLQTTGRRSSRRIKMSRPAGVIAATADGRHLMLAERAGGARLATYIVSEGTCSASVSGEPRSEDGT